CRTGRSARSRTPCWCGATSRRSSPSATRRWLGASLDGELALHAGLPVAGHRAVELVRPRLEVDGDRRGVAAGDRLGLLLDAVAVDLHPVRRGARVREVDRDL